MKIYVLYDKKGIHSGRALGSKLISNLYGKATVKKGRLIRLERLQRRERFDYIVNIGYFKPFDCRGAKILNDPIAVGTSSNKRKARIIFRDNEVPSPKLFLSASSIRNDDLPVVGRTTHHMKGKGLWYCKTLSEAKTAEKRGATHFIKFIPNTREFRIHVVSPKIDGLVDFKPYDYLVLKLSEKLPKAGAKTNPIVKSHNNGWAFSYPKDRDDPVLEIARSAARKALASVGLNWGAVDVMVSKDTDIAYVLEINSAPCLTDEHSNTLDKYAGAITSLVGLGEPMEYNAEKVARRVANAKKRVNRRTLFRYVKSKNFEL